MGARVYRAIVEPDEADLAEYLAQPPLARVVDHLAHAFLDVRDLPQFACDSSWLAQSTLTNPAFFGCRSAFYVAARSITEFFIMMPPQDYTARDFLPAWQPSGERAERLERVWVATSKHVVHLSRQRTDPPGERVAPWDTTLEGLSAIGRDCWAVLDEFTDAYTQSGGEHADQFTQMREGVAPTPVGAHASWEREKRERFRRAMAALNTPTRGHYLDRGQAL